MQFIAVQCSGVPEGVRTARVSTYEWSISAANIETQLKMIEKKEKLLIPIIPPRLLRHPRGDDYKTRALP